MKLATLRNHTRDGALIVVNRRGDRFASAARVAPNLQAALEEWESVEPRLATLSACVEDGSVETHSLDLSTVTAPLPRAYEWVDGSAYLSHLRLVRKARNAELPRTFLTDPLVYQGGSGVLLGPTAPLTAGSPEWGLDFEGEVCVILGDTPRGVRPDEASRYVRLVTLANDVTYRGLVPSELEKGFGFFCSKPATAFAPFVVTPDELGHAWRDGRVHLHLLSSINGLPVGNPHAGDSMHFSFFDLVAHITRTRAFTAGTILGSGTVSDEDPARGVSCLVEKRMREIIEHGAASTPFLAPGDRVRIEMLDARGDSVFGAIDQEVLLA